MFSNRIFQITLLVSLIIHGIILFRAPGFSLFSNSHIEKALEVSYLKNLPKPKENVFPNPDKKDLNKLSATNLQARRLSPPPFIDREAIFQKIREAAPPKASFIKPALFKPDIVAIKKKISLPPVELDKIKSPSYMSYYQIVREKIRRAAYKNYTHTEIGEVYLSFAVSQEGNLKEVRPIKEKSANSPYLNDIALKSIQDASPFPAFPKELDYPQLSFNIVISFEIE